MLRKCLTLLFVLALPCLPLLVSAQDTGSDIVLGSGTTRIQTKAINDHQLRIEIFTGKVNLRYDAGASAYLAGIDKGVKILKQGAPDLQQLSYAINIPSGKSAEVKLVSSETQSYANYDIAPSLGNISRDRQPGQRAAGTEYSQNTFYPATQLSLDKVYQVREAYGQSLTIAPLQYNPVSKELKVYTHLVIEITFTEPMQQKTGENDEWSSLLQHHFLNYGLVAEGTVQPWFTPVATDGRMLIVTPAKYLETLKPFIQWKNKLGIRTHVLNLDTLTGGANATNIQQFIKNKYAGWNLSYVLLIGDNTDVPAVHSTSLAGPSDAAYAYVAGNDHYPDLMIGRFSANTTAELKAQIDRTIAYEKTPTLNQAWYKHAVGVASNEGPGDNNEYDWEHMRNIRTKLMNATGAYTTVAELYDGTHGGQDAAGNPTANDLKDILNNGTTIMNYCGHGASDYLVTTGFNNATVPQLTNDNGNWPFVWGVACVSGEFENQTCLGEKLLRQVHATTGKPLGAIAAFFSTINQYWDPPMRAQDAYIDMLTDGINTKQKAIGTLTTSGTMNMNDAYNTMGEDMTDTWLLFGDPSVKLHTQSPTEMTVTHPATVSLNTTTVNLNINVAGAKAVLYYRDSILSIATAAGGSSTHTFPAASVADTIWVTVSADYRKPYIGYIRVLPTVGIEETAKDKDHPYVYPNPAQSLLHVGRLQENCSFSCYNAAGALVRTGKMDQNNSQIDISGLAAGHYYLKLTGKEAYKTLPFQILQ
jgi:gingipain R